MHLPKIKKIFKSLQLKVDDSFLPIVFRNLTFSIDEKKILSKLNLSIKSNSITVIMGPNGAGKSILLKLINGILEPSSGAILWNGNKITSDLKRKQALIFQKPILLRRSVISNLDFIEGLIGKSYNFIKDDLLSLVGLLGQKKQPAKLLSLGEQQRLSLVRSLLLKPSLILLDEPTANLDPATTKIIENIIVTSKQFGIKIIFVTHNILQAKRLADEVVFIDNGELVEYSNADNFFSKPKSKIVKNYLEGKL
tara:strand:+ start:243 stop:998 length:756 start_codon:yes stop_codon:yes gene_type:complete